MHLFRDIDYDLGLLSDAIGLVDQRLDELDGLSRNSEDPDGQGVFDQIDYFVGFGFVACQVYLNSHLAHSQSTKSLALAREPIHRCGVSMAALTNAAANMWKHQAEWPFDYSLGQWRYDRLLKVQRHTIEVLEKLEVDTRPGHYSVGNALQAILMPHPVRFGNLLPFLKHWRDGLYG